MRMLIHRTISEDGTVSKNGTVSEVFEDGTEAVEEIEYVDDEEFSHETLGLHLLSAHDECYEAGMHPLAICAETVHYASAIPPYPISPDKGYAYVIDTRQIDEADVKEPWNACTGVKQCEHLDSALQAPHYDANDHPYWTDRERVLSIYREPNNLETAAVALALTPGGHYQWFLRCCNYPDEKDFDPRSAHRNVIIPDTYSNDGDVLKTFQTILADPKAHRHTNRGPGCVTVDRTLRVKKTCDKYSQSVTRQAPATAYIQSFYDDGDDFLAVCFTQGMSKLWEDCKTFQFDMNFKRVNGNKDHEVIFARRMDDKFG
ncbi:hypothetical protein E4U39_007315, partial [Claviceps sp. Clav50 group G5]